MHLEKLWPRKSHYIGRVSDRRLLLSQFFEDSGASGTVEWLHNKAYAPAFFMSYRLTCARQTSLKTHLDTTIGTGEPLL